MPQLILLAMTSPCAWPQTPPTKIGHAFTDQLHEGTTQWSSSGCAHLLGYTHCNSLRPLASYPSACSLANGNWPAYACSTVCHRVSRYNKRSRGARAAQGGMAFGLCDPVIRTLKLSRDPHVWAEVQTEGSTCVYSPIEIA